MPRFYFDLQRATRERAHRPDAVDARGRRHVPGRRGPAPHGGGDAGRRLRPPRGLRRRDPRRPARPSGFALLADPAHASQTVTAAWVPEDLDWKAFNGEVKRRGLVLAGGQGKLKGRIFRVGHLGSVEIEDILGAIAVMEEASPAGRPGRRARRRGRRRPAGRPGRRSRRPARARRRRPGRRHEDPRRRAARPVGRRAPAPPSRGRRADRPLRRRSTGRSSPSTTRSSSAARSRSTRR